MRKMLFLLLLVYPSLVGCANEPAYRDTNLSFEARARDLVSRMTLDEKVSQMIHLAQPIERLGIPYYNWMNECLHGVANMEDYVTVFPQSIGMGASWDTECMYRVATAISDEARAMHHNGYKNVEGGHVGGLTFWSPNINLFRDPRWGRGQESYGEDPYHIGQMAIPFIRGLQGNHPKYFKLVSTVKHYVVHSGPEPERHEFDAAPSERDFWETYMPHFVTALKEADVYSVMCAYNRYNGESCCGSNYLLNGLLRERFDFEGYIVSDCGSVTDIFEFHEINDTPEEAAALAVKSGVDLNCGRGTFFPYESLPIAIEKGLITESEIDTAVYRLMLARMKLGMFDPPEMVPFSKIPEEVIDSKKHQALALEMARKSIVLLKNEKNILPLKRSTKKIAVIGPNANNENVLLGNYHGIPSNPISLLTGLKNKLPQTEFLYSKGCDYVDAPDLLNLLAGAVIFTDETMSHKGINVEFFNNRTFSGKPVIKRVERNVFLTSEFGVPYEGLEEENFSVRWSGSIFIPEQAKYKFIAEGNENCNVYLDNKLIIEGQEDNESEYLGLKRGRPYSLRIELVADVEEFDLSMYWKIDQDDLAANAMSAAKEADIVIMVMGISNEIEGEELGVQLTGFEGGDRTVIELPAVQQRLIKNIESLNKPVVLVLMGGGSFALPKEHQLCDGIVMAWYPGQAGGTAIADVLFGDYNPGGKLPLTFYKSTKDLPDFRNYDMEGRTYRFFKGEPLYAFGYGLSYTSFAYSDFEVPEIIGAGEDIELSVKVKNTGEAAGDEVVQVYVKDVEGSVRVPRRSLQGFKRVHLRPGQTKTVSFTLLPKQIALLNDDMEWMVEPGEFLISVGGRQPGKKERVPGEYNGVIVKEMVVTGSNFLIEGHTPNISYKDSDLPIAQRVGNLLSRMSLKEKLNQTFCYHLWDEMINEDGNLNFSDEIEEALPYGVGQLGKPNWAFDRGPKESAEIANKIQKTIIESNRLGIPAIFHEEGLHGLWARGSTVFPQAIGLSCSWDPELAEEIFKVIAKEIRSRGSHQANTPMLDICRDPRWGRIEESYGEDPYLTSRFGVAIVKGLQGTKETIDKEHIVATIKHFAGYGLTEGGLNKTPVFLGERTLRQVVLPPFKAAIMEAGALSVMPAYHEIEGIACHANKWLLMHLLKIEWGFKGYVVSDYNGVRELNQLHHVASNNTEAGKLAMLAGVDMELDNPYCFSTLLESIKESSELQKTLDESVRRILSVKFKLGLFDDPFVDPVIVENVNRAEENIALSLKAAQEAIVLLKNKNDILPLDTTKYKKIAVIGPHANDVHYGGYSHKDTANGITFYQGIKHYVGESTDVIYAKGCNIHEGSGHWLDVDDFKLSDPEENKKRIQEAAQKAKQSDLVILAVGSTAVTCGEFIGHRHSLDLFGQQNDLVEAVIETNVPVIVCLVNGRPLTINAIDREADAVLETWYLGEQAGIALAKTLFGDVNPSGKLTLTFPRSTGHLPAYYGKKPSGIHDYLAEKNKPLYPFGYGLSYTTFDYSNLSIKKNRLIDGESTTVRFTLENTGRREGEEIVQLYIRDRISSVTRPVKELKGFKKVSLKFGETKTVEFQLSTDDLKFYNHKMEYVVEPGEFDIMVGASSEDIKLKGVVIVTD